MNKDFEYYYNNVPGKGLCRNNLIYTSLISSDKTVFVQWYNNDTDYHRGQNQVVDHRLMDEKFHREVKYLQLMTTMFPTLVPKILDIDMHDRKIFLEISGVDFWQCSLDSKCSFDEVLPDWRDQMLTIFKAHSKLHLYKYSLHPSSYFIVNGQLKSINYFFTYHSAEPLISLRSVLSHISEDRLADLIPKMSTLGIDIDALTPHTEVQQLAFESFKTNFPADFMDECKKLYV